MAPRPGLLRHLAAVLLLPTVVTVVVPWLLTTGDAEVPSLVSSRPGVSMLLRGVGSVALSAGVALLGWCVALFARVGRGTLAPWDPTRRLVTSGPYRYVRNPMISAVAIVLLGETLLLLSPRIAGWLVAFVVFNHIYFLAVEEPGLHRRFGDEYDRYRRSVPRWLPRTPRHRNGTSHPGTSS